MPALLAALPLLDALANLLFAFSALLSAAVLAVVPWLPLLGWVAFWLLAVNWRKLYPALASGGWIGVLLIALLAVMIWSTLSVPAGGFHNLLGLHVNNLVGKIMYVAGLLVIAMLSGMVQLSGACDCCVNFSEPAPSEPAHGGHGHH